MSVIDEVFYWVYLSVFW